MEVATKDVIGLVESTGCARACDFDVARIVVTLQALVGDWDFDAIDRATFWAVVATNIR